MSEEMLSSNGSPMFMPVNFIISSYNTCPMISWLAANKPHPSFISILVLFCFRNVNKPKPTKLQNWELTHDTMLLIIIATIESHGSFLKLQSGDKAVRRPGALGWRWWRDRGQWLHPSKLTIVPPSPNSAPTMSTIFQVIAVRSGHHLAPRFGSRVHESVSPVFAGEWLAWLLGLAVSHGQGNLVVYRHIISRHFPPTAETRPRSAEGRATPLCTLRTHSKCNFSEVTFYTLEIRQSFCHFMLHFRPFRLSSEWES